MEGHQAGQNETLMEVKVEMDGLEVVQRPRSSPADHRGCFKCVVTLAAVMGLIIVALVAGFILQFSMFTPSCNQDAPPSAKVNKAGSLKKSEELGRYDIFTVDKGAKYIIYVHVKFSDVISEEVELVQTVNGSDLLLKNKNVTQAEVFLLEKVTLVDGSRISIYFDSPCTDSSFRVFEL